MLEPARLRPNPCGGRAGRAHISVRYDTPFPAVRPNISSEENQMAVRREGVVKHFLPDRKFGFIVTGNVELHFHLNSIRRDWRGSVAHATTPGAPVTFIKRDSGPKAGADDVCGIFMEEQRTPLEDWREVSRVKEWNGRFGELTREGEDGGDPLFFHRNQIVEHNRNRIPFIEIGNLVYHGVGTLGFDRCGRPSWVATNIELYSDDEQDRLQRGLPAYEEPEPVVEPASELLTPVNRSKTIRELIEEKRRKC
jgi:hypothetical protein